MIIVVLFFKRCFLYYISLTKYYYEYYYKGWINLPTSLQTSLNLLITCFSSKDTSRKLTAAFDLIHHADPSSSLSMITQLYTTIDIALPTRSQPRPCSPHVSDSSLPLPHQPSGHLLLNASLIWLAGGMASGSVELSVIPDSLDPTYRLLLPGNDWSDCSRRVERLLLRRLPVKRDASQSSA